MQKFLLQTLDWEGLNFFNPSVLGLPLSISFCCWILILHIRLKTKKKRTEKKREVHFHIYEITEQKRNIPVRIFDIGNSKFKKKKIQIKTNDRLCITANHTGKSNRRFSNFQNQYRHQKSYFFNYFYYCLLLRDHMGEYFDVMQNWCISEFNFLR